MCSIDYESALDEKQYEAVTTTEGYVRVIAGAGSGKTRALTYRYAYLVDEIGVGTDEIACITFTRRAAEEMRVRIRKMLPDKDLGYICTFHSLGYKIIKEEHNHIRWTSKFHIMNTEKDTEEVLRRIYKKLHITTKDVSYTEAMSAITQHKATLEYINGFKATRDMFTSNVDMVDDMKQKIVFSYLADQRKNFLLDYDDMICIPLYLFKKNPEILRKWASRFEYFMVDEFQDVSGLNYAMCEALTSVHHRLFVVGDPDQLIYSWRGAKMEYFMEFPQKHENTKDIELLINRRSKQGIVEAANRLINHNQNRIKKSMTVHIEDDALVNYYHASTRKDEASFVADKIKDLLSNGIPGEEIAVLYRAHYMNRAIYDELKKRKINVSLYSNTIFYDREEVKNLLAYLRLIIGEDDTDFERAIQFPKRKVGKKAIEKLSDYAKEEDTTLYQALKAHIDEVPYSNAADFVALIDSARACKDTLSVSDMIHKIMDESGMEAELSNYRYGSRLDSIAEILEGIRQIEDFSADELTLEGYLEEVKEASKEEDEVSSPVSLMTIHAAKGLEFDYVFVIGMSEKIFPTSQANTLEKMEEERRIAYVAYTRAKDTLYLTDAEREDSERDYFYEPSRFIFDTDLSTLNILSPLSDELLERAKEHIINSEASLRAGFEFRHDKTVWEAGDVVTHKRLGEGVVLKKKENGSVVVRFFSNKAEISISDKKKLEKTGAHMDLAASRSSMSIESPIKDETTGAGASASISCATSTAAEEVSPVDSEPTPCAPPSTILEFINQVAKDPAKADKVSAMPLMCGAGKSTAISQKIAEVVRQYEEDGVNDGLLVVSDTIAALEGYLNPTHIPDTKAYIDEHMDQICVIHSKLDAKEYKKRIASKQEKPVLIITTQRYFSLTKPELIDDYLTWDKGRRSLVLIDEQPYMKKVVGLNYKSIDSVRAAIFSGLDDEVDPQEKNWCITQWKQLHDRLEHLFESFEAKCDPERSTDYFVYDPDTYGEEETLTPNKMTINDDKFMRIINNHMNAINRSIQADITPTEVIRSIQTMLENGSIITYARKASGKYDISSYSVIDMTDQLLDLGSKVIILDGTADISPEYMYEFISIEDCSAFNTRRLDNLHIRIINCGTSKNAMATQKRNIAAWVKDYMNSVVPKGEPYGLFTYKETEDVFRSICDATLYEHFGNIKGRNDMSSLCHIAQVGLFRYPAAYYLLSFLHTDMIDTKLYMPQYRSVYDSMKTWGRERQFNFLCNEIENHGFADIIMYRALAADIEQNLFRMKIRRHDCTEPVYYYLFANTRSYTKLINLVIDRFETKYGAHVEKIDVENGIQFDKFYRATKDTKAKKLANWILKNDTAYDREYWAKDIIAEAGITAKDFENLRRNKVFKEYFAARIAPGRNGHYKNPSHENVIQEAESEEMVIE